jgi:hypothetical protein
MRSALNPAARATQDDEIWPKGRDPRVISAPTLEEAMAAARRQFGLHVQFVAARTMSRGVKGLLGQELVEVLVASTSTDGAASTDGTAAEGSGTHAFATLEDLLDLADGADGIGRPIPMGRPYEQAYGHNADPRYAGADYDTVGYGYAVGDEFGRQPAEPDATPSRTIPTHEVSFDALVREALDRVPSYSTHEPGPVSQLRHPAPEVVVDPIAPSRPRPMPIRTAPLALGPAQPVLPAPKWSRRRLLALGLPRHLAEALPLRAADDDAGWTQALTAALAQAIESASASGGSIPAATVSGRGGSGAIAIVKALAVGAVPDEFDDGNGMRPASPESLARSIRSLL